MKELIGQYAGTAIAAMIVLLLLGMVIKLPCLFEKMLPQTKALVQEESFAFESCWWMQ